MSSTYQTKNATTATGQTTIYSVYADGRLIGSVVGNGSNWRIASDFYSRHGEESIVGQKFGLSQVAIETLTAHHGKVLAERRDRELMAIF